MKFETKMLFVIGILFLPFAGKTQQNNNEKLINQPGSIKIKHQMESKIVIGKIFVPQNSIEEFRKQAPVTPDFLKTLQGFVKNEAYEMADDSGNLHVITVVTWQNDTCYNNAQHALADYYQKIKFNRMEFRERLKITAEYGVYSNQDN